MSTAPVQCTRCEHPFTVGALFCSNCGAAKPRDRGDELVGKTLAERYALAAVIGSDATGTVYRAEHVTLRRKVAVKVLHAELSRDDLAVERFRREATSVADIENEHILTILDFGRMEDGRLYMATELLDGESLTRLMGRQGPLPVDQVADIVGQIADALAEAHAIGYVHRDLRPANIYLAIRRGVPGFVKLLDFGLAKLVDADQQAASTSLGMKFGDPTYMSPEQAQGGRIDKRADIYQLGCVAYHMLTGRPPFVHDSAFEVLRMHIKDAPTPLPTLRADTPLWLEALVTRMLAKDPNNRFASMTRVNQAVALGRKDGEILDGAVATSPETELAPAVARALAKFGGPSGSAGEPATATPAATPAAAPGPDLRSTQLGAPALSGGFVGDAHGASADYPQDMRSTAPGHSISAAQVAALPPPGLAPAYPAMSHGATSHGATSANQAPVAQAPVALLPTLDAGASAIKNPMSATAQTLTPIAHSAAANAALQAPPGGAPGRAATNGDKHGHGGHGGKNSELGHEHQQWFADGEADPSASVRLSGSARLASSYNANESSEWQPPKRSKKLLVGALLGVVALGGGLAFALTRGDGDATSKAITVDAAPPLLGLVTPDAATVAPLATPDAANVAMTPPGNSPSGPSSNNTGKATKPVGTDVVAATPTGGTKPNIPSSIIPGDDDILTRRPGGGTTNSGTTNSGSTNSGTTNSGSTNSGSTNSGTTNSGSTGTTTTAPKPPGPSGTDETLDPYAASTATVTTTTVTPNADDSKRRAEELAVQGEQAMDIGDFAAAAGKFSQALELNSSNLSAVTGLGEIAMRQGSFDSAIAHFSRATRIAPRNSRVHTLLGDAYAAAGKKAAAVEAYERALELNPDNANAKRGLEATR